MKLTFRETKHSFEIWETIGKDRWLVSYCNTADGSRMNLKRDNRMRIHNIIWSEQWPEIMIELQKRGYRFARNKISY